MKQSCKYCAHLRKFSYKISSNGKHKLYGCCVHGHVVGEVEPETDKGLDQQGCSSYCGVIQPGMVFDLHTRFNKGKGAKNRYVYIGSCYSGLKKFYVIYRTDYYTCVTGFELREKSWLAQNIQRITFVGNTFEIVEGKNRQIRTIEELRQEFEERNKYQIGTKVEYKGDIYTVITDGEGQKMLANDKGHPVFYLNIFQKGELKVIG